MTVKQIKKIRDFGIFKKFDWNVETPDFTSFNLAYGWNYCGKTTLSRIFRCFELGSKHIDYESAKFEIEDLDGKKYTELSFPTKLPIRVFNTDFITDNLKWNEGIEPIFMLGEINIRLQSQLDLEKANMVQITKKLEIEQDKLKVLDDRIYWSLSNKAGEIKNTLVLITFDKRHFEQLVLEVLNDTTTVLLSDSEVEKYLEIYKSTEKKSVLGSINITLPDILKLCDETNQLLIITVTAKVIEKLKKNPRLNEWVKEGKELHKGLVDCE